MILTYRYRVKDRTCAKHLRRMASAVNFVWNFCCETQLETHRRWRAGGAARWPSHFDLCRLTTGASREIGLHSDTVNGITRQFVRSRGRARKCPKWRSRRSGSLGWIPLNTARAFAIEGGAVTLIGRKYRLWYSRPTPEGAKIKTASFNEDARGRWYFNICIEVAEPAELKIGAVVAIDLGLKDLATFNDGRKIEMPAFYRRHEAALATAQKRGQKRRARALHARTQNCRRHFLHEHSTRIVREHARVIVGDVNAAQLKQTTMAKSVSDAGWSMFRTMLQYKCLMAGASFEVVSEAYTTQACSECGCIGGPKGIAGLRMRRWTCEHCGASHDRDVNAARNLLAGAECRPPDVGIAA